MFRVDAKAREHRHRRAAGRKDGAVAPERAGGDAVPSNRDPPRDRRRRVEKVDRPKREPAEPVDDERIMGAASTTVSVRAPSSRKHGAISAAIIASATGLPASSASA